MDNNINCECLVYGFVVLLFFVPFLTAFALAFYTSEKDSVRIRPIPNQLKNGCYTPDKDLESKPPKYSGVPQRPNTNTTIKW